MNPWHIMQKSEIFLSVRKWPEKSLAPEIPNVMIMMKPSMIFQGWNKVQVAADTLLGQKIECLRFIY